MLHTTATGGKLLRLLAPVGYLLVVDHVVSAESLELLALLGRGSGGNDLCTSSFRELHSEHADTTGTLGQDPVTGLEATALQTVQTVPCSEASTCESAALQEVKVGGHADEALLVEGTVLLQGTVDGSANTSSHGVVVKRASKMTLVEESEDFVALLEASHTSADFFNDASTVGCGYDAFTLGEWVEAFHNGEITVVERGAVN